jgi:hypothetical protein
VARRIALENRNNVRPGILTKGGVTAISLIRNLAQQLF